ncbi:late exocytosis, associated with Golgi transport-domain-containing protein [Flammula alnicola]|nr:late exocytosis, associated with Golgi transport-domain-containing protein [Flammula alnicola]
MASIINNTLSNTDNSRTLAPAAVGSQVALMSVVSVVTILLFNFLRPQNKIIYEPKVKYHEGDKPPPRISDSLFGWLPPLIHTKEPELLDKIGLDAVAFLRFLRLLRTLFSGIAILTCGILIPINVVYNLKNVPSKNRDILSMLTIRDVSGNFLYAHVVVTYLITFLIVFCVNMHWRAMVQLRHTWFRSPEYLQSFYARTLQVRHVPKKLQSDEGLNAIFGSVKMPYPTTSVHIGRKVGKLPELIDYHNQTVREFEEIGGHCGLGGTTKMLSIFTLSSSSARKPLLKNTGTQIDTRKAENYGFASMAAVPYAHIVAKMIAGKHPKGTEIQLAPNPKDIHMNNSDAELARKRMLGFLWLSAVCFFNTVPLFIISILANLDSVKSYVHSSKRGTTIRNSRSPSSLYMGGLTHSKLDRAVVARYFTFLIISQLIFYPSWCYLQLGRADNYNRSAERQASRRLSLTFMVCLVPALETWRWNCAERVYLFRTANSINRTYINQASYWLTFFPLRGFLAVFDLAQIINLVWLSFKTHVFGRTPRDIREWTQPPDSNMLCISDSNILFMSAVGLVFAPLAPLVVVAAAIVFWMSSWVYKYQLMFVFVSKVESGGRIWNVVINRLLFCVLLMQALMILTTGLQFGFKSFLWLSVVPPILIVFAFKLYINRTYLPAFYYFTPTEEEIKVAKIHSERADATSNRLEKRFGHPALHTELFTPMLHKNMMPLLSQVYQGKIGNDHAKLDEYGGQNMEAQIVPGGIKIAAIDQRDLEYDPALYQRDRGELDWDARSIASTVAFGDGLKTHHANLSSKAFAGYDKYLTHGPGSTSEHEIELSQLDSMQEPLLSPHAMALHQQGFTSQQSLSPSLPPSLHYNASREAPLHRPQDRSYSPSPAYMSTDNLAQGQSPISPYPTGSEQSHQSSYFSPTQSNQMRGPSPGPYGAMQYPPQQHARQASGNMLAGPSRGQSPTQSQQQHARQNSGNILASSQLRTQSPGPYQAYSPQQQQQRHARQSSGNLLASSQARTPSPGPYQAYSPQPQQQHARQTSGNMLADNRSQSPGPYQAYSPQPQGYQQTPPGLQSTNAAQYQQQQQQSPQANSNNMAGRGAHRGY